jgi:uncharacterized membrane-anchored protein
MTTGHGRQAGLAQPARPAPSKVPQITASFWITKVISTGQGEALADWLYLRHGVVIAATAGVLLLVVAMVLQFWVRRYMTWVYWLAVTSVSVFGTMAADGLHLKLGVPYSVSTPIFALAVLVIFVVWYRTEKTLSIHSIYTFRREAFYWCAVVATFALGTALGDLTAYQGLGFFSSGLLFAGMIAIPAILNWKPGINAVLAFWWAYVLTRPLGASFADWFGVGKYFGGLGYGRGTVALVSGVMIIGMVTYMAVTNVDKGPEQLRPEPKHRGSHRAAAAGLQARPASQQPADRT